VPERIPYRTTFLRLLGFLRPYRTGLIVSAVLATLAQAAQLVILYLVGSVVKAVAAEDKHRLMELIAVVLVLGIAKASMLVARRFISGRQALGVEFDLRNLLYSRLVRLSYSFYDRHQVGQIVSRATVDLQAVRFFLGYGLIFFFQHVVTVVGVTIVLFFLQWQLALISLAIAPLLALVAYRYSHVSHPLLRDVQQTMADVATVAEENVVGVNVVKAFAQEQAEEAKFRVQAETVFTRSINANRQTALYVPLMAFLPGLAQAGVLLVGGIMVVHASNATDTLATVVRFSVILLMLVQPLRQLGTWIGQAQRATASGERIFELIDSPLDVADPADAVELPDGPGLVEFEHVSFGYAEERPVLRDVTLTLEPGTTVALIGHTGSGKTTLATLVPRFYDVIGGSVSVDGVDVRKLSLASLRHEIGVVSQDPFLFSATVRENVAFGRPDASLEDVQEAARLAQAAGFIEALPNGYDTVIGERGITLSGGQRQRIAIARALLLDPRILIFDDATASVDATTEAQIRQGLREATKDRTTIIIAHRLSTIALADEIVVLDGGTVAARGTHDDLIDRSPVYRTIYEQGLLEREFIERLEATA
jgi:ABC-type multidrug transport system fused ATPase/permease subunit